MKDFRDILIAVAILATTIFLAIWLVGCVSGDFVLIKTGIPNAGNTENKGDVEREENLHRGDSIGSDGPIDGFRYD